LAKAREALVADGRVRRVGSVSVLSVYDNPCIDNCAHQQVRATEVRSVDEVGRCEGGNGDMPGGMEGLFIP
jgi:hypothetical protein